MAAARAEQALSDVTSSLCSNLPRPGPQRAWHVQLKIWLLTGELYVRLGRCDEAMACAQEASALNPASHHVMYLVISISSRLYKTRIYETWRVITVSAFLP